MKRLNTVLALTLCTSCADLLHPVTGYWVVGEWRATAPMGAGALSLRADSTYLDVLSVGGRVDTTRGTFRVRGDSVTLSAGVGLRADLDYLARHAPANAGGAVWVYRRVQP